MDPAQILPLLLGVAVLAPLASFFLILVCGPKLGKNGKSAAAVSIIAILTSALCAFVSLGVWVTHHPVKAESHAAAGKHGGAAEHAKEKESAANLPATTGSIEVTSVAFKSETHSAAEPAGESTHAEHEPNEPGPSYTGNYYILGTFGHLQLAVSYYIDALTITMFCMVTLIASCIHFYASGYMHDELHDFEDPEVPAPAKRTGHGHDDHGHDSHGHATQAAVPSQAGHAEAHGQDDHAHDAHGHDDHGHGHAHSGNFLVRPGRYHRFFQALSLFCFSMLGLVLAGNIAMVFMFWELVGICSYFLIGFYVERKSASTAANKAFIVNRVGDFGMIIGLSALWASLGTFAFGDMKVKGPAGAETELTTPGLFSLVRSKENHYQLQVPEGMVLAGAKKEVAKIYEQELAKAHEAQSETAVALAAAETEVAKHVDEWRSGPSHYGRWLLIIAGVGIFCGCVGKSAQFPLHTWLPDAMEGPTPVSALVHSATMVAAGVYLVGRFYPVFCPEVLLVIAVVGMITLFMAATIAITATDIKRVLAYSTVSQLGYMMLALGVGGWLAGMMHLVTHAFFKSLLFLCSGSVIHAVHTNEMPLMGGLRKKMPVTAYTMLIGCLAIAGAGLPGLIGFSGFYSKDAILEQALSYWNNNIPWGAMFFAATAGGAAITSFYMFRLWFMTFAGKPRDQHRYDHAHESPAVMYVPLVVLSVFAIGVAWQPFSWSPIQYPTLSGLLEQARPAGTSVGFAASASELKMAWPAEHESHKLAFWVGWLAFGTAVSGFSVAAVFYGLRWADAAEVKQQFLPIYHFLRNKWWFDELYDFIFVRPCHLVAKLFAGIDKRVIDRVLEGVATLTVVFARIWDRVADRTIVDGIANGTASWTYSLGLSLRGLQTGKLRQYVMFIVVGTIALFLVISFFWRASVAG